MHRPTLRTQRFGHRQTRENVPAGAGRHDQSHALPHARIPRIFWRFSKSTRSTMARATKLIKMAEPP